MACSAACLLLVVLLAACVAARSEYRRQVSVRKDAKGQLEVVDGLADDPIATAQFNNTVNSTGSASVTLPDILCALTLYGCVCCRWSFLKVWGHGGYDGVELARAAGMVEASITGTYMSSYLLSCGLRNQLPQSNDGVFHFGII